MQTPPLVPAVSGQRFEVGGVSCYVAGEGPPLLLLHSVNAAASAAEIKPLYEHYRAKYTVFAPELPGYGFSDRGDRAYKPRLMTDALHLVAQQIRQRCGTAPIDALAVSLGCEFLARAAMEQPTHWGKVALVSPTGLMGTKPRRGPPGSTRALPWLYQALANPRWAQGLFNGLTKPAVVRYFLRRTWGGPGIDAEMADYAILTARQPGARFAPLHFLGAGLFSADIHDVYEAVRSPVWASHGVRGDFTDYRGLPLLKPQPPWRVTVFPTGALPFFEVPEAFRAEFDAFLAA
ncbi:MAG: alpha/beta hydrolase [Rubrivivax sp.]|nr:alpha/beta hydrolase [Rubrivivax sp.]